MSRAVGSCPAECALTPATTPDAPSVVTQGAEFSKVPQPPDLRLELRDELVELVEPCGPLSWHPPFVGGSSRDPAATATIIVAGFDGVPVVPEHHAD